jgi:hypothetical protein
MERKKKAIVVIVIVIVIAVIAAAMLYIFRDSLFQKEDNNVVSSFNSDIVIKRMDTGESLNMSYKYAKSILDKRRTFIEEIANINISSVRYKMEENNIKWYTNEGFLVKDDTDKDREIIDAIKYCKGISALSGILSDREDCKIMLYEGYSEELLLKGYENCAIIPSSMSKYINKEIPDNEKVLFISDTYFGNTFYFTIIGEYKTKSEYDTLYVSYAGLTELIRARRTDIPNHVDSLELDVYENKDLTGLVNYLSQYFAEGSVYSEYEGRFNVYNEPYEFMYVHSLNIEPVVPLQDIIYANYEIIISRIDGKSDLEMSHVYSDALIEDYDKYSQHISDIVISTGVKGVNPDDYPTDSSEPGYYNYPLYSIQMNFGFQSQFWNNYEDFPPFYQAVTGISEIKSMKKNCKVTLHFGYSSKDMIVPKQTDIDHYVKGYAVIPLPMHEANRNRFDYVNIIVRMNEAMAEYEESGRRIFSCRTISCFKVIGYYETTDKYDVIYITYAGSNEKYKLEPFENEHIESVTLWAQDDTDIKVLQGYLEQYFAPATDTSKYAGKKNALGRDYEYCYTIKSNAD